ncbi:aminotransferase class I/II-fold pyridoxal phosphate-dependent enzyme [Rubellicoccus peritrichatus]|uniref:GDP-perosamine synthase n=1 Tax=Rubellicoccus peritrichatus TaxID=3080537 RepID=A0AAQ3QUG0_9BACT|nr:aminotransferase class I/II-fold pyridoxal phosphate-dependent enzyme [Puniceicoccus sp. CR14]WOO42346.1 aminotransferase class I/II-fold pyridoxal phosphate-dependent enzyme [Puniceicoccus sp. CR14]
MNTQTRQKIYLSPPEVSESDIAAVTAAMKSGWVAPVGPAIRSFEEAFEGYMGGGHAVALSSGTAALHLSLQLSGVGPGDEVFCSTLTFAASANAIIYCGARPVFIDSDEKSWNMDPNVLADALQKRAREGRLPAAVELVHAYGQSADIDPILELCHKYGIPLIEDAAEAIGATYKGKAAGGFGNFGTFSFNGNKLITTSGGGMLWTEHKDDAERARYLATQARLPDRGHLHEETGYNYRLSNLLAALGESQLSRLQERIEMRHEVFKAYVDGLADIPGVSFMPEVEYGQSTRWLSCLLIDETQSAVTRNQLIDRLQENNIESRPIWRPLHKQPVFDGSEFYGSGVSERLAGHGISLPSGGEIIGDDQSYIIASICNAFGL